MKNEELGSAGIPFVRGGDIGDGWINTKTVDHIRPEFIDRLRAKLSQPGDTAFIIKGTIGRAGFLRETQAQVVFAPQVAYWRSLDKRQLEPRFIYYLSRSAAFLAALDADKTHGAMVADYVSISQQLDFRFQFPPIREQQAISEILGALDDKIELNRRMNETLEAMARAIFKDWFVDFGPVRAKQEGRTPYLAPDIWSLFPDRLDDEGKPEGWEFGTLSTIANLNPESWGRNYPEEIRYVDLSNTKWGMIETVETHLSAGAPSRAQRILRPGDTIVGTVRPGNGSYAFVGTDGLTGSTGFAVLRPKEDHYRELVYYAATSVDNIDRLAHLADGGAYPAVRSDVVIASTMPKFGDDIARAFSIAAGALLDRAECNKCESKTLAALRDLLLPKLMSGEIRVRDAEKLVGQAA
jgi:type I restriction enzyme, S subunit